MILTFNQTEIWIIIVIIIGERHREERESATEISDWSPESKLIMEVVVVCVIFFQLLINLHFPNSPYFPGMIFLTDSNRFLFFFLVNPSNKSILGWLVWPNRVVSQTRFEFSAVIIGSNRIVLKTSDRFMSLNLNIRRRHDTGLVFKSGVIRQRRNQLK